MSKIILFGGAFDPIHLGHLNMAKYASDKLDAKVIFIPAKISVWKSESAPIEDKIKMIELAIKDSGKEDFFIVSRYEADLPNDVNYSIDTVKHFKETYKNDEIYLLIGTDQVNSFHKWKDASELAKLARIIYFERTGYALNEENIKKYEMMKIDGEINDINSSDIRSLKDLSISDSVIEYIIYNDLYFMNKIKYMMSSGRYIHSKSVAKLSYEIAKANHVDEPKKALIAGLIHDCAKELNKEAELKIMKEHFSEYLYLPQIIYHQFVGAYIAEKEFGITDKVILDAIKYHTTANSNMSDIGLILYCTDKIEPTRGFYSEDLIKSMKSSIKQGFKDVMKSNIEYYDRHGIDYRNPLTVACLEQYYK